MVELAGGKAADGLLDVAPGKTKDVNITLTQERLQRVLGIDVPPAEVRRVLEALGFGCRWVPPDHFIVRVPYWRTDVTIADDVIEEVARIIGYDEFPTTQLRGEIPSVGRRSRCASCESAFATCSWPSRNAGGHHLLADRPSDSRESAARGRPEDHPPLRVANPMSREYEYARTTLRGSMLQTLATGTSATSGDGSARAVRDRAHLPAPRRRPPARGRDRLRRVSPAANPDRWQQPSSGEPPASTTQRRTSTTLFAALHLRAEYREAVDIAYLPGRTAEVWIDGRAASAWSDRSTPASPPPSTSSRTSRCSSSTSKRFSRTSPRPSTTSPSPLTLRWKKTSPSSSTPTFPPPMSSGSSKPRSSSALSPSSTSTPAPRSRKARNRLPFSVIFQAGDHTLNEKDPNEVDHERRRIVERLKRELNAELRT